MTSEIRAVLAPLLLAACALPGSAAAAWNTAPETIEQHPTWIYTPAHAMANGKHPLMIVLHGCNQTHGEIKDHGNLAAAAEANGTVMAVPFVGSRFFGNTQQRCWDYNGATDSKGHIGELVRLAQQLKARTSLQIDARHVYIVGLSSGGAMALAVGCKAPDVFAGIGAAAGPTVGSSQFSALTGAAGILPNNVDNGIAKCRSLAGNKASHFATQIANISYGDMDRDGPRAQFDFSAGDTAHPGQYRVVSTKWSHDNVKVLQSLYGAGELGAAQSIQNGLGTLQVAQAGGNPRISLVVAHDVGHAWSAGTGQPNDMQRGGRWIAQRGLNYPDFVAGWLISHNMRAMSVPPGNPELSLVASISGTTLNVSGTARDPDGTITRIDTVLLKGNGSGAFLQADNHASVPIGAAGDFADSYTNLPDGRYKVQVTVTDNSGRTTTDVSAVQGINPPPLAQCHEYTDNNVGHVARGRALVCGFFYTCAKGSGDSLGLFNIAIGATLRESSTQPGVFRKGACPQA